MFNRVRLEDGYSGSVVLARDLQVNILEVGSGYIAQNYAYDLTASGNTHAGDFTVSGTFAWTGGGIQDGPRVPTYNSLIVPGIFNLAATATGTAEPTDGQTVQLGSIFTLLGNETNQTGSTLEVKEGTYTLLNNPAGFVVAAFSTILFKAPIPKVPAPPPTTPGKIVVDGENKTKDATTKGAVEVERGGLAIVKAANRTDDEADYFALLEFKSKSGVADLTNAGTVIMEDRAWLKFDHTAEEEPIQVGTPKGGFLQEDPNVPLATPLLRIEAGCQITCVNKARVNIVHGSIELTERKGTDNNPLADQPKVVIQGSDDPQFLDALVLDRAAKIGWGQGRSVPIPLKIEGQLRWDGDIELYADNTQYTNDSVEVTKRVIVGGTLNLPGPEEGDPDIVLTPKLRVAWFNAALAFPVPLPEGNGSWTLVTSDFTNAQPPAPQLDPIQGEPQYKTPNITNNTFLEPYKNEDKNKLQMKSNF